MAVSSFFFPPGSSSTPLCPAPTEVLFAGIVCLSQVVWRKSWPIRPVEQGMWVLTWVTRSCRTSGLSATQGSISVEHERKQPLNISQMGSWPGISHSRWREFLLGFPAEDQLADHLLKAWSQDFERHLFIHLTDLNYLEQWVSTREGVVPGGHLAVWRHFWLWQLWWWEVGWGEEWWRVGNTSGI